VPVTSVIQVVKPSFSYMVASFSITALTITTQSSVPGFVRIMVTSG
jgi:hypothetical protein